MSKKRGLSHDEKRHRLQELFFEKKDFFQLKELEKIAPKEKGITSMSVKEVLQSLVDDGLVDTEKIGTSVYFWSYPSKAMHTRKRKIDELSTAVADYEKKISSSSKQIKQANVGREESENRESLLQQLADKEELCHKLEAELETYRECDPDVLDKLQQETAVAKEAANRWTDNVFAIKSWCKNKFNVEEQMIDKNFGIPEDFDYLD
ncbi:predicted protein [Nematostella vectensis]|uniref:Meiotic nuclear division protein 1 homolog n=1 Tax=Nematostella vectensis TaxID=45351 RepID=A7RM78_NEMVE|nr:meiotic nuclear division protein 1 homolog [Nematostella vectensis]EDO47457.1 predicted protein [Nematostella vectensis]|eukprot:XP_001639520.1 predicted protein [Nematostella vectensis]